MLRARCSTLYPLPATLYPLPSTLYLLPSTLYPLPSTLRLLERTKALTVAEALNTYRLRCKPLPSTL
eukprot:7019044-Pyramimonas_sp.AAC.1